MNAREADFMFRQKYIYTFSVILIFSVAIFVQQVENLSAKDFRLENSSQILSAPVTDNVTIYPQNHHIEYGLTTGSPLNIVIESPGRVWYTLPTINKIGLLVASSATASNSTPFSIQYSIPTSDSEPYDLAYANGFIWFTERQGNKIGRLEIATEQVDEFTIPTSNSSPRGIDIGPNGDIWFTEYAANQIGRFDPVTMTFTEYPYISPSTDSSSDATAMGFEDIAVANTNILWVTASESDQVIYFDPDANIFYSIPTSPARNPTRVVLDNNGSPWITTASSNLIGYYIPGTLSYWYWFEAPNAEGLGGIALRDRGGEQQVVFAESNSQRVGQFQLDFSDASITSGSYSLSNDNSQPMGVAIDASGTIWIADSGTGRIVQWNSPYFSFVYLPIIDR